MSKEQLEELKSKLEYYLHLFGYAKYEGDEKELERKHPLTKELNKFDFYNFEGSAK